MGWDGPILTDSGGFQVFSLGFALEHGVGKIANIFPGDDARAPARAQRPKLTRIDDDGVTFTSHLDGSAHRFTPEVSIAIQQRLGADAIVCFDECTSPLHDWGYTARALERTHRWADRCLAAWTRRRDQALFGIVQGGAFRDLRERSARFFAERPFPGYCIGGSLGKDKADMHQILEWSLPLLPEGRPRHLLGIGDPADLFEAIERGIDLFDCVAPTRLARHGALYTADGRLAIKAARHARDRDQALFGIVQGGAYRDLRERSARFFAARPFPGYCVGGSLGRDKADMHHILEWTLPLLPEGRPRHLLGIGDPVDLFEAVERGIDLFDCVAPTRLARHGALYTADGRLSIKAARHARDHGPIEAGCGCYTCARFSRGYLRHLFVTGELLGPRLASIHNLHFIVNLVKTIRAAIFDGAFAAHKAAFLDRYRGGRAG
jgi:queuine/archaeosine tRNA-ribosyltransferase